MAYAICIMDWEKGDGRFESFFSYKKGKGLFSGIPQHSWGGVKGGGPEAFCLGSNFFITTSSWTRALQYGQ